MADAAPSHAPQPAGATGVLVLADGHVAWGRGFGAEGAAVGEVCFNTAMTGYQEVMTDPSYAGQIVPSLSRISAMSGSMTRTWKPTSMARSAA